MPDGVGFFNLVEAKNIDIALTMTRLFNEE